MRKIPFWDFSSANSNKINKVFFDTPWNDGLMTAYNVNQATEFITNSILFTLYTCVPLKQSFLSNSSRKTPWFNKKLRCLVRKRRSLFTKWKKSKLNEEKLAYNKIRNLLQRIITEAKINQNKLQISQ